MPTASSNRVIPKESLTAWERWELGALAEEKAARPAAVDHAAAEAMRAEAVEAGRRAGHAEGMRAAQAEIARLKSVADSAVQAMEALSGTVAEQTVALALAIAHKVLDDELHTRPEQILTSVRSALAAAGTTGAQTRLLVHPDDAPLITRHLGERAEHEGWLIVADPVITRGGCRLQSVDGDVDATLESRIHRVLDAMGAPHAG